MRVLVPVAVLNTAHDFHITLDVWYIERVFEVVATKTLRIEASRICRGRLFSQSLDIPVSHLVGDDVTMMPDNAWDIIQDRIAATCLAPQAHLTARVLGLMQDVNKATLVA